MPRAALRLAVALLLVAPAVAGADVADYLGKRVVTCRVAAEGQDVADPRVIGLVQTRPGTPLSLLAVRESVTHLHALGRFEDVRVRADAAGDGVALVYELVPVHPIRRIHFTGLLHAPGIDEGRLRKAMVDRYGQSPPAGRQLDLATIAEDDLREHGYLHPVVTPRIEIAHNPDRATLTFAVEPGERTLVSAVEVAGTPGVPIPQLLNRLKLKAGVPYERDALAARTQEYQADRRTDGYVQASIAVGTRFENNDRSVVLTVTANQGPRVNVLFKGDSIPGGNQDELVPVVAEGSADEDLLEDSSLRIEDHLRALGYRDAVAPYTRETVDGELRITYTITRGALYRVTDVEVTGNTFVPTTSLDPRFTVRRNQPLSDMAVGADASTIVDIYRRLGFAAVKVEPVVVPQEAVRTETLLPVTVRYDVTEGVRTIVNSVRLQGNTSVAEDDLRLTAEGRQRLGLQPGRPFFVTEMALDRDRLEIEYADRGYPGATIAVNPGLSADATRADVVFMINEGRQLIVDHVLIVGNERTATETIERELRVKQGEPLGTAAVLESQRNLARLGLFRRIRITQVPHGEEDRRDVVVLVDEAPVTSVGYGGGIEALERVQNTGADSNLEIAPRAFFEIGRRNLFGTNRSVNLFTGVSLREDNLTDGGWKLQDYRVVGTFREPRLFGTPAVAYLTGTIEQQTRTTFRVTRHAFSTEVGKRLSPPTSPVNFSVSGNYQIQRTALFDDKTADSDRLLIDRLFPQVRLSSFSLATVHTNKDDALNPTTGHFLSANGQLAARQFGSEVGLFKTYLTAQLFRTLPRIHRTVFASSVRLGMARGFQSGVQTSLPASERFFAGGDTTVRGFALDQLGAESTLDANGFAIGGNAVVLFNAELRVPVYKDFGVVGFFDAGNVFARTADLDLGQLRGAYGFGFRYRSPVGPIRVDVGFKVDPREIGPGIREKTSAIHISLGQAF